MNAPMTTTKPRTTRTVTRSYSKDGGLGADLRASSPAKRSRARCSSADRAKISSLRFDPGAAVAHAFLRPASPPQVLSSTLARGVILFFRLPEARITFQPKVSGTRRREGRTA